MSLRPWPRKRTKRGFPDALDPELPAEMTTRLSISFQGLLRLLLVLAKRFLRYCYWRLEQVGCTTVPA